MEDREYVMVAPGRGRRWVAAASKHGRAWVLKRTASRVHVAYLTGTGRERSIWVPLDAVTPWVKFLVYITADYGPGPVEIARRVREEVMKLRGKGDAS